MDIISVRFDQISEWEWETRKGKIKHKIKRRPEIKNEDRVKNPQLLGQMSIAPRYFSMLSSPRETKKFRDEPKKA
jgi:hypothetical protein